MLRTGGRKLRQACVGDTVRVTGPLLEAAEGAYRRVARTTAKNRTVASEFVRERVAGLQAESLSNRPRDRRASATR